MTSTHEAMAAAHLNGDEVCALIAGDVDEVSRARAAAHLRRCPSCRACVVQPGHEGLVDYAAIGNAIAHSTTLGSSRELAHWVLGALVERFTSPSPDVREVAVTVAASIASALKSIGGFDDLLAEVIEEVRRADVPVLAQRRALNAMVDGLASRAAAAAWSGDHASEDAWAAGGTKARTCLVSPDADIEVIVSRHGEDYRYRFTHANPAAVLGTQCHVCVSGEERDFVWEGSPTQVIGWLDLPVDVRDPLQISLAGSEVFWGRSGNDRDS